MIQTFHTNYSLTMADPAAIEQHASTDMWTLICNMSFKSLVLMKVCSTHWDNIIVQYVVSVPLQTADQVCGLHWRQTSKLDLAMRVTELGLQPWFQLGILQNHYHEEDVKIRQEAKGMGIPRPLLHTGRSAMLRAVEQSRGTEIGEKEQPSTEYIAMILEEIERTRLLHILWMR